MFKNITTIRRIFLNVLPTSIQELILDQIPLNQILLLRAVHKGDGNGRVFTNTTTPTGGNRQHNTMPPYCVLSWIMKL